MATYYSSYSNGFRLRLELTQTSTNISANTSNVSYAFYLESGNAYFQQYGSVANLTLNGVSVYSLSAQFSANGANTSTLIKSGSLTVAHNADGTKSMAYSGYFETNTKNAYTPSARLSLSGTFTLTTIPRKSIVSLNYSSRPLGSAVTISTNRASTDFKHTITYKIGSLTGTIATGVEASFPWTPPNDLAKAIPSATSGTVVITCATYNGSTNLGSSTVNLTVTVPNNTTFQPSIDSTTISEGASLPSGITAYVQSKSKLKVVTSATGKYSATIKTYAITIDGTKYTGSTVTSNFINKSGYITVSVTVTDSRGYTMTYSNSLSNFVAYHAPRINNFTANRAPNDEGTDLGASVNFTIAPVSNQNTKLYRVRYREMSPVVGGWVNVFITDEYYSRAVTHTAPDVLNVDKSYEVELYISDAWGSVTNTYPVGTGFTLMNFNASGKGMAIGKVSEKDALEIGMPAYDKNGIELVGLSVEAWQTLPLVNGWTPLAGQVARYYKHDNRVYIEGYITGSTSSHFATMPVGYRPDRSVIVTGAVNSTTLATMYVQVLSTGVINFAGSSQDSNKYFSFSYRVA